MIWSTLREEKVFSAATPFWTRAAWEGLSWNLMCWFGVLMLFLGMILVSPTARELALKRVARLQERDEREELITGKAARAAYLAGLSFLIVLLFFSIFSLNVSRIPDPKVTAGKTRTVEIGVGFSLLERASSAVPENTVFASKGIPLSKTAILLSLLVGQLAVFGFTARRENRRG